MFTGTRANAYFSLKLLSLQNLKHREATVHSDKQQFTAAPNEQETPLTTSNEVLIIARFPAPVSPSDFSFTSFLHKQKTLILIFLSLLLNLLLS